VHRTVFCIVAATIAATIAAVIYCLRQDTLRSFVFVTPSPIHWGNGVLFSIDLFVSFFVSLLARLRENGWTDLQEIFREGAE